MSNKFLVLIYFCFLLNYSYGIVSNKTDDSVDLLLTYDVSDAYENPSSNTNKCTVRLQSSLEKLRRRQSHSKSSALIDLSGYALHQTLTRAPLDMYVTDIKVRTPGIGNWVRVQKCQFSNRDNRVTTQILFNDLTVSGFVKLFDENVVLKNPVRPEPNEFCSMTLRLRRAGLGINAFPTRERSKGIEVRTEARFMDPNFLSVHAYGCKFGEFKKENKESVPEGRQARHSSNKSVSYDDQDSKPEIRIINLGRNVLTRDNLQEERDADVNEYHKDRILSSKLQHANEKDKLKAVLHMKNILAQQANQVFQMHGPFSQNFQIPPKKPPFQQHEEFSRPSNKPISTITELDENLTPIRPVPHKPFEALFASQIDDKIVNFQHQHYHQPQNHFHQQSSADEVSREMEDVFLRGIKTLLTKYLQKQLEIPLKEALLVNIGYTVSYG